MSTERKLIENLPVRPHPLSLAISALVAAPVATAVAQDQSEASSNTMLEEVTVTARKREENLQMIPQSIQAISAQTIEQAGLRGMDDYVRFIPSLNIVQANPGTAKVVFRGIADAQSTFIAEPSAAVYLDEQSLVVTGQPNPRLVDIERIEALSGPQGTLFGASAQSGVLRIITNKPDPTAFDAYIDGDIGTTKHGDMSYDVSGMVNIPLSDTWALRLVGFNRFLTRLANLVYSLLEFHIGKAQVLRARSHIGLQLCLILQLQLLFLLLTLHPEQYNQQTS
jgi:iron complex outermembrane receptor protein